MAEAVAIYLTKKIGGVLVAEGVDKAKALTKSLHQIHGQMRDIQRRLELIQAFIVHADEHRNEDKLLAAWVKQVRELAFDIDYLVDLYTYTVTEARTANILSRWVHKRFLKVKNMKPMMHIADELKKCYMRLDNLSKDKIIFGVDIPSSSATSNYKKLLLDESQKVAVDAHFIPDEDIFGVDDHKALLKEWLEDDKESARTVICVWGMGGVGKTTLVTNVYKSWSIVNRFERRAWVSVSRNYNRNNILRKIIKELHRESKLDPPSNLESKDCRDLVNILNSLLRQKRYLIILDVVWVNQVWLDLINIIYENNMKSKVIITTRHYDVARAANVNHSLELKPLDETNARALFNYHVFRNRSNTDYPISLEDWERKIVQKCDGLPLALVWMANYLATKEQLDSHSKSAYNMLISSGEKNIVDTILSLSVTNLPYYLQSCFLYCSIFPEDYAIEGKKLLRLWISEGFVTNEIVGGTNMELAEDYLNQLVSCSMFQVAYRNNNGKLKRLIIHDLVREMILKKQKFESSYEIWNANIQRRQDIKNVQCLSIFHLDEVDRDENNPCYSTPRLHSLHLFSKSTACLPVSNFKLLRILNIDNSGITCLLKEVNILFNLRYLSMRGTNVKNLPNNISRLQNLETLDFRGCREIRKMPVGMSKLNKLQHLMGYLINGDDIEQIKNLKQLQTLKGIITTKKIVEELGSLIQLRSLKVWIPTIEESIKLAASIANMKQLVNLTIRTYEETHIDLDGGGFIQLAPRLHKLYLDGRLYNGVLPKCLHSTPCTSNHKSLTLEDSELKEDLIPIIAASLPNLRNLMLYNCLKEGIIDKICFPVGSFPNLTTLGMEGLHDVKMVKIQEPSLVCLERIYISNCKGMNELPQGIENLANLKHLLLRYMSDKFIKKVREERSTKLRHIPLVEHCYMFDGNYHKEML